MLDSKKCIYCAEAMKLEDGEICSNCKSKVLSLKKTKLKKQFEKFEVESQEESKPDVDADKDTGFFPIPKKGEIVEGLLKISQDMLDGVITRDESTALLQKIETNVSHVFDSLVEDMEIIPIDIENYKELLMEKIEKVEFLFRMGLQEMSQFNLNEDPSHIEYGQMLCQIGEERYIQLLKRVACDATGSPFEGMENVPEQLASELKNGNISKIQFDEELQKLKNVADDYISKAKDQLDRSFELAAAYNGQNDDIMIEALAHFNHSETMLSKVILNFHSSDEIERIDSLFQS